MAKIYLNAGNLWDHAYLDQVIAWNKEFEDVQVTSLFGSMVGATATARSSDRLPARDWEFTESYVWEAHQNNIMIRYTLNQSCIGAIQDFEKTWRHEYLPNIKRLHNMGIVEWTISSPLILELMVKEFPSDFFEVSTIAEVATPEELTHWRDLGADGVCVSTSINRDFTMLERMAEKDVVISLLANEACLYRCPWRKECYNLSSHDSWRGEKFFGWYPFRRCNSVRMENPEEWVKSRLILPQWMQLYKSTVGIDHFKVAFRTHPKEIALPMLHAYMSQSFHNNLLELWPTIAKLGATDEPQNAAYIDVDKLEATGFIRHFVAAGEDCTINACEDCGYCTRVFQKTQE